VANRRWLNRLVRDPRGRLKRLRLRLTVNPLRTALEKREVARSAQLTSSERELLRRMDSRVHPYEDMYEGDGRHYFKVAVSTVSCLDRALEAAELDTPSVILDMPCGYGRELRALAARFPQASFTACDIRPKAVRFCARRFGAEGVVSSKHLDTVTFGRAFDLIWCGTLMTNFDAPQTLALLDLFARSADRGALIVFTTHGESVRERLREGATYGLAPQGVQTLIRTYEQTGYGYADYPWETGYGISVISPRWMRDQLKRFPTLREVYFAERDWDDHQDVFGVVSS
jgi:SAM-dependent methyltransferase